jgi:hypothetical protein
VSEGIQAMSPPSIHPTIFYFKLVKAFFPTANVSVSAAAAAAHTHDTRCQCGILI